MEAGPTTATATTPTPEEEARVPRNALLPDLPRAAELLFGNSTEEKKLYWDRSHYQSPELQMEALKKSSTLYIGNLAFSTRAQHVRNHFRQAGPVKAVHMGLDRFRKTPCGFGFVEYHDREDALAAVASLSGTKLDGRVIRAELDAGFQQGRQYGRGPSGGQVRDDRRKGYDSGRNHRRSSPQQPPRENNNNNNNSASSYYGGDAGTGDKRDRDAGMETTATGDEARPEKNPRFRED